jgi:hypothetical protein
MEIMTVVHPSLDEYATRIEHIASKCGVDSWLKLTHSPEPLARLDESDRSEFYFIQAAVGDLLLQRELFGGTIQVLGQEDCVEYTPVEPEPASGSTVYMGEPFDCSELCRSGRSTLAYV